MTIRRITAAALIVIAGAAAAEDKSQTEINAEVVAAVEWTVVNCNPSGLPLSLLQTSSMFINAPGTDRAMDQARDYIERIRVGTYGADNEAACAGLGAYLKGE